MPSLKPLLNFKKLESLFVLTGRGEGFREFSDLHAAIEVEKPSPKEPEEGRFRWLLSEMVGDVKKRITPPNRNASAIPPK